MSKTWTFPAELDGLQFHLTAHAGRYDVGEQPAIYFTSDLCDEPELFSDLTLNVSGREFNCLRDFVLSPDLDYDILKNVIASGLVEREARGMISVGLGSGEIYRLTPEGFDWYLTTLSDMG